MTLTKYKTIHGIKKSILKRCKFIYFYFFLKCMKYVRQFSIEVSCQRFMLWGLSHGKDGDPCSNTIQGRDIINTWTHSSHMEWCYSTAGEPERKTALWHDATMLHDQMKLPTWFSLIRSIRYYFTGSVMDGNTHGRVILSLNIKQWIIFLCLLQFIIYWK